MKAMLDARVKRAAEEEKRREEEVSSALLRYIQYNSGTPIQLPPTTTTIWLLRLPSVLKKKRRELRRLRRLPARKVWFRYSSIFFFQSLSNAPTARHLNTLVEAAEAERQAKMKEEEDRIRAEEAEKVGFRGLF